MSKEKTEYTPQQLIDACRTPDGMLDTDTLNFMSQYYDVEIVMYMVYDPQFDISRRMDRLYYDQTI